MEQRGTSRLLVPAVGALMSQKRTRTCHLSTLPTSVPMIGNTTLAVPLGRVETFRPHVLRELSRQTQRRIPQLVKASRRRYTNSNLIDRVFEKDLAADGLNR